VIGVIPESLAPKELSGEMIGQLQVTEDMHTRRAQLLLLPLLLLLLLLPPLLCVATRDPKP
jgi:hypothetical protein